MEWECPGCGSDRVVKLPANSISRHPGYLCRNCRLKMRTPGRLLGWILALALGLACSVGLVVAWLTGDEEGMSSLLKFMVLGAIVAGYSLMQIVRPLPRRILREE